MTVCACARLIHTSSTTVDHNGRGKDGREPIMCMWVDSLSFNINECPFPALVRNRQQQTPVQVEGSISTCQLSIVNNHLGRERKKEREMVSAEND